MQTSTTSVARDKLATATFETKDVENVVSKGRGRSRRAVFLTWLRKIHLYVGLWGAALGLMFGGTGILLNHRAVLKIPVEKTVQRTVQIPVPAHGFQNPEGMGEWLKKELNFAPMQSALVRRSPRQEVVWDGHSVMQPERWNITVHAPNRGVQVEYFVGNQFAKADLIDATPIGTLTRLHMSVGVSPFWVLLADTIAGSLILLSLTGLLLWTQLHTLRTTAVLASVSAVGAATWYMWSM